MNQHIIQKAWLKQFHENGQVRVVDRATLDSECLKPKKVAYIRDVQSPENECSDRKIESAAIDALCALKKGATTLTDETRHAVREWVAIHHARSIRDIQNLNKAGINYERGRTPLMNDSRAIVAKFKDIYVIKLTAEDEPLILSDQPIVQLKDVAMALPFSPRMMIILGNDDPNGHTFRGRTWNEALNEMSFQNSNSFVVCHPRHHPDMAALRDRTQQLCLVEERHNTLTIPAEPNP